jgi:hypothetical protein
MSYDLEIWTAREPAIPAALPTPCKWARQDGIWVHSGNGWQLVVDDPIGLDAEDVPEQVGSVLPGLAYLTRIALEPGDGPKTAHQLLMRSAKSLAKTSHGVFYDPQEDSVALGSGVKKFAAPGKQEQVKTLSLSWWFGPDALATKAGFEDLVKLLRRYLPEALPRRYGTFEPPQYRLAETGDAHLVEFLETEGRAFMPVIFPHRPVTGFVIHLPEQYGQSPGWEGFRANTISINLLAAALQQPGWERQIQSFWRRVSDLLQPFYGDVRFLVGVRPHPIRAWFWRGFPSTDGVAAVVGPPYIDLWPPFASARKPGDSLAYFGPETWVEASDVFEPLGGVPAELINPNDNYWSLKRYPSRWPFDLPA